MSYDYDLVANYKSAKHRNPNICSLHLIDFQKIYTAVCITGNHQIKCSKHSKYELNSFVIGHILQDQNRSYLMKLYKQNGGDINCIKPRNASTVRNTLTAFDAIPNVIRLDILNPITFNILFSRWMDMQLNDIEDYQLFTSLISSVVPEIGRNFICYFVENKCFKTSKRQYVIDTIPSFKSLQKKLNNLPCGVIQLCILPTLIISDNMRGISLAFKQNDVWQKEIIHQNDEKEEFDDNICYKWQFKNDSNQFQDFTKKQSKMLEKNYLNGASFVNFHRQKVAYQINFQTLCQKNLNSTKLRSIRRVPEYIESVKQQNERNKIRALQYYKWQYMADDGVWTDYSVQVSKQINSFKKQNQHSMYAYGSKFGSNHTLSVNIKHRKNNFSNCRYLIDVNHCKQQNIKTRKERNIRQIVVYDDYANETEYKWQYKADKFDEWTDYDLQSSQIMEKQWKSNSYFVPFVISTKCNKKYKIFFNSMRQQSMFSKSFRSIRRQAIVQRFDAPIKHRWEWLDDDKKWNGYHPKISAQIESACNSQIKKFYFVANKNSNSYEINFKFMNQCNVQTGKQRKVRKISLKSKWNGPKDSNRRMFGDKVLTLYAVVGDMVANEVRKCGKLIRGTLGPFGAGLYFYDNASLTKQMAENRSMSNKGNLIECKVLIGKERNVSNLDDQSCDFMSLQQNGCDSVSRCLGFGKEFVVYNCDQISVVKVEKYQHLFGKVMIKK